MSGQPLVQCILAQQPSQCAVSVPVQQMPADVNHAWLSVGMPNSQQQWGQGVRGIPGVHLAPCSTQRSRVNLSGPWQQLRTMPVLQKQHLPGMQQSCSSKHDVALGSVHRCVQQ